jgi:hypothetical protein
VDERFIVGKAVSVAASLYEKAQGAFVWLDPLASAELQVDPPSSDDVIGASSLLRWDVPLKGGDTYNTFAVVPFSLLNGPQLRLELIEHAESIFKKSSEIGVQVKRQRSIEFMKEANRSVGLLVEKFGKMRDQGRFGAPDAG